MPKIVPYQLFSKSIDRSLRSKITLMITLPMVVILTVFLVFDYAHHRTLLLNNLSTLASNNGALIEESLQHSMLVSDFAGMQVMLDTIGRNRNIRQVYLLDNAGKVVYSPFEKNKGAQLDNRGPACLPCHNLPADQRPSSMIVTDSDGIRVFRSMQPINNGPTCVQCHDPQLKLLGVLLTDISVARFDAALVSDLRENILIGGSTILLSAILVNLVMSRLVTKRLERVATALASFGSGSRDLRLSGSSQDEIGQLEAGFNRMDQQIQVEEAANRHLSKELYQQANQREELLKQLITAQEAERNRVARELHDELGQALSGLALHSQVIERFIKEDPDRALKQLALSREVIEKTTEHMYELILALRPSELDDLGLVSALHAHGERLFKDCGVKFILDTSGLSRRLPASIETALYRTFQEALSNIVKHSHADCVTIKLARNDGHFDGEVSDNGIGFDPEKIGGEVNSRRGIGLLGMQERIIQCGGRLHIHSAVGKGTHIHIRIPLSEDNNE